MARILWNIHLYPPDHNCGSEYVAHHVNKYLISKGHHVRVILQQYKGPIYNYEGVEVFPATSRCDAFAWGQVLLTHLDFTQYTMMQAAINKQPVVHFVHNDIQYPSITSAKRGQHIVYNSNWIGNKIGYDWPSVTLHPPCDTRHYNVNDDPEANEHITLISLNERKGGDMFRQIAEALPNRKFLGVVGSYDNPGPKRLTQPEIMASMPPNVTVVPNSPDILSVYKRTRLLLMPSDYESWGRTATEAMCNGIPVICTPTEGLVENCGEAATYVGKPIDGKPGDAQVNIGRVQDWVKAIKKYDNKSLYHEKSVLCKRRAAELDPLKELERLENFILNARY